MTSWLALTFTGSNEIFAPLLPENGNNNDDENPAGNDDDDDDATIVTIATISTTETVIEDDDDPQDSITAAAIRAVSQTPSISRRSSSNIDAAKQRRRRLRQIQSHLRSVTQRVSDVSVASDDITHQMEHIGTLQYDSEAAATASGYYGVRLREDGEHQHHHEDDDSRGDDEKVPADVMKAAFIITLLATAGLATYLCTLWDTLTPVVKCFVPITFVWLGLAMISIGIQCLVRDTFDSSEQQREEELIHDRSQSQIVAGMLPFFF
mmetsp:Transcript_24863/g.44784  ORF Transcript_24863/g.44784 Transcript_24863/m.44784 type:complete len:265 (-) Transcript_24863:80-874(-)